MMRDILLFLGGVLTAILVEVVVLLVVVVRAALKKSGQDSREPIRETVIPVIKQE